MVKREEKCLHNAVPPAAPAAVPTFGPVVEIVSVTLVVGAPRGNRPAGLNSRLVSAGKLEH